MNSLTCVMDYRIGPFGWARLQAAARLGPLLGLEMSADNSEHPLERIQVQGDFLRVTVFPEGQPRQSSAREMIRRLHAALDQHRPQSVAIVGWSFNWSLAALLWCLRNNVPAILLSDSTAISNTRHWWRESIKRRLVKLYSAGLVAGTPQREYLAQLGMPEERIFHGWDVVDNEYFAAQSDAARSDAPDLRVKLWLPEKYFLAVSRFIEVKNLPRLIEAYAGYCQIAANQAWPLVLVGDGPMKAEIFALRSRLGLETKLILPGFKQYSELPQYYGLASAFVIASTAETWGLVVNEAMASGLPVLVSERCGCARDLVRPGTNGFTFDPFNVSEITRLMVQASAGEFDLAAMGRASRQLISQWSPALWAANLQSAVNATRHVPLPKCGLADRLVLRLLAQR